MNTDSSPESARPEEPKAGKASAAAADVPPKLNNTLASKFDRDSHRARNHAMEMMALMGMLREQEGDSHWRRRQGHRVAAREEAADGSRTAGATA
jgi:hypothetical protein